MRQAQRILLLLAGLLGLLLIAAIVLVATFDPNDYRDRIERIVTRESGREFTLEGDIDLALFPQIAVEAGPARLSDGPAFGPEPFLTVERVSLRLQLLPLLSGRFEFGGVRLEQPTVRVIIDSEGSGNWSDLVAGGQSQGARGFSIGHVVIDRGAVHFEDRRSGTEYTIRALDLDLGSFAPGRTVPVATSLVLEHAGSSARLALDGSISVTTTPFVLQLDEPRIELELLNEAFGLEGLTATLRVAQARITQDDGLLESLSIEARPRLDRWPDGLPAQLQAGRVTADLEAGSGSVEMLELDVAGAKIESPRLSATQLTEAPRIAGTMRLEPLDLREWLARLAIEPPAGDPTALAMLALTTRFELRPDGLALDDLDLELDATRTTGSLAIVGFDAPALRFDLDADAIDLDRYLPAQEPDAPPGEIPLDSLQGLDLAGTLRIAQARIAGMDFAGIRLVLESDAGALQMRESVASLAPGDSRPGS